MTFLIFSNSIFYYNASKLLITYLSMFLSELTEVEIKFGPLALYVEDAFVTAAVDLFRLVIPQARLTPMEIAIAESDILQHPLRLQKLHLHSLDLTLTLHTAVSIHMNFFLSLE